MAQNPWNVPAKLTTKDTSRGYWNDQIENLVTLHSGTSAPSTTYSYMLWADTTNTLLKMRNSSNDGWITIGTLAANLGMLRIDGTNAMTGALDFNGQQIKDPQNSANTATPGGTTSHQIEVDIGGATVYVPAYSTAWT